MAGGFAFKDRGLWRRDDDGYGTRDEGRLERLGGVEW